MTKAFVLMNQSHQPIEVYVIPDGHTTSHHINQLHLAAADKGRYGLMVDVLECGAPQACDIMKKKPMETP